MAIFLRHINLPMICFFIRLISLSTFAEVFAEYIQLDNVKKYFVIGGVTKKAKNLLFMSSDRPSYQIHEQTFFSKQNRHVNMLRRLNLQLFAS